MPAQKLRASPPQKKWGAKKHQILDHFFRDFRTRHRISPERNVASTNENASVNLQCFPYKVTYFPWPLTQKRLTSVCLLWPNIRRPLRCNHQSCDISSSENFCWTHNGVFCRRVVLCCIYIPHVACRHRSCEHPLVRKFVPVNRPLPPRTRAPRRGEGNCYLSVAMTLSSSDGSAVRYIIFILFHQNMVAKTHRHTHTHTHVHKHIGT